MVLAVDPVTGKTSALSTQSDAHWVDLVEGVPARLSDGRLVTVEGVGDALTLIVDGHGVTPADMEVRSVVEVSDAEVLFTASTDPLSVAVWRWEVSSGELTCLTPEAGRAHWPSLVVGYTSLVRPGWATAAADGASRITYLSPMPKSLRSSLRSSS